MVGDDWACPKMASCPMNAGLSPVRRIRVPCQSQIYHWFFDINMALILGSGPWEPKSMRHRARIAGQGQSQEIRENRNVSSVRRSGD